MGGIKISRKKLLEHLKILDFTQGLAGPLCSRILADLGAEILKVERSPRGDLNRPTPGGDWPGEFLNANVGKKSICVDFHNTEGAELIRQLVPRVDAVMEAYSPGQMKRYGLDYESLRPLNAEMVYCSMSGYGQYGSYRDMVAFNPAVEAMSGLVHMTGEPDSHPQLPGFGIGDTGAAVNNCVALLAALLYRETTGVGQYVETSMLDSLIFMGRANWVAAYDDGKSDPGRWGQHRDSIVPYGLYECKGEYLALEVIGEGEGSMWGRFCHAIGSPDMISDPRFDTPAHRVQNREETIRRIQAWFDKQPNASQAWEHLQKHRVVCAPVLSPRQIMTSRHARERQLLAKMYQPVVDAEVAIAITTYKFSRTPVRVESAAPLLGQHNEEILHKYLSYSDSRIQELYRRNVIHHDPCIPVLKASGRIRY